MTRIMVKYIIFLIDTGEDGLKNEKITLYGQGGGRTVRRAEFKEDTVSFFGLSGDGRGDMLSPRIHMTILEKGEGCLYGIENTAKQ